MQVAWAVLPWTAMVALMLAGCADPAVEPAPEGIHIAHVEHDAAGVAGTGDGVPLDRVEVCNNGPAQGMTAWTITDEGGNTFRFDFFTLPSGGCVKVHTGSGSSSDTDIYWGRSERVWDEDHDTARLWQGDRLIDAYAY